MKRSLDVKMTRLPVERPDGTDMTYACPGCDILLADGPAYSWCPACELPVDWVDVSLPVWACPSCDLMVNGLVAPAGCDACDGPTRVLSWPREERDEPPQLPKAIVAGLDVGDLAIWFGMFTALAFIVLNIAGFIVLALDPKYRLQVMALFAPLWLIPLTVFGARLWTILASLGGLFDLVRNQRTRVIHGFEHATIAIFEEELGMNNLGGRAYVDGFEIDADNSSAALACQKKVKAAAADAMRRIKSGETDLTLTTQCGTSLFVAALIQSVWITALGLAVLFNIASATTVLITVGVIVLLSIIFRDRLGIMAQRHLTVSTVFKNARPLSVIRRARPDGRGAVFEVFVDVEL